LRAGAPFARGQSSGAVRVVEGSRSREYEVVSRVVPPATAFARTAGVAALAAFAAACAQTLDAGRNNPPDPCATGDAGVPGCTPTGLLDNLIGHWRLDDGAGSTVAYDSSGRGNEGTLRGLDANTAWVAGRSQGALDIGHAGWVQVAPSPSIDSIEARVTLSAWVNLEGPISASDIWATALSRQIGTTIEQHYHLSLIMDGRPSLFIMTVAEWTLIQAADPAPTGAWTHLAGVYDGAAARLYVNGVEVASQALTGSFAADTTPVILGGNANDGSGVPIELFTGRIDELMLYARALTPAEIAQLAAGALFPGGPRDAGSD
jgi:hypothetical protein